MRSIAPYSCGMGISPVCSRIKPLRHGRHAHAASILLLLLFSSSTYADSATQPATQPKPTHVTFTESSPLSPAQEQHKRYALQVEERHRYKLADESFEVFVPQSAPSDPPMGLLVWISPSNHGAPPKDWSPLLTQHHLIGIGANNAGNERAMGVRIGLALDAAQNIKKQYHIDEKRVYVAGMSGGAKMAVACGIAYPDVFTGCMPICGVIYYRNIPVSGQAGKLWPLAFVRPPGKLFDQAKKTSRFVLITGGQDSNRDSIKDTYEQGFVKDKFAHCDYVEIPGMGHAMPDAKAIEQAIETMDKIPK